MAVVDQQQEPKQPLPINRIVAFAGPYIAIVSGALADWLLVHVHLLGIFHTTKTATASMLTQGIVFSLTAILVWAGHHKWLTGWQQWAYQAAAGEPFNGPDVLVDELPAGDYDPVTAGDGDTPVEEPITPQDPTQPLPGEPAAPPPLPEAPAPPPEAEAASLQPITPQQTSTPAPTRRRQSSPKPPSAPQ